MQSSMFYEVQGLRRGKARFCRLHSRYLTSDMCRKCIAPVLGFSLPSTSFKANNISVMTAAGKPIATAGTAMFHIISRGVCRIVATIAVLDSQLHSGSRHAEPGHPASGENTMASLDSFVCKAVRCLALLFRAIQPCFRSRTP